MKKFSDEKTISKLSLEIEKKKNTIMSQARVISELSAVNAGLVGSINDMSKDIAEAHMVSAEAIKMSLGAEAMNAVVRGLIVDLLRILSVDIERKSTDFSAVVEVAHGVVADFIASENGDGKIIDNEMLKSLVDNNVVEIEDYVKNKAMAVTMASAIVNKDITHKVKELAKAVLYEASKLSTTVDIEEFMVLNADLIAMDKVTYLVSEFDVMAGTLSSTRGLLPSGVWSERWVHVLYAMQSVVPATETRKESHAVPGAIVDLIKKAVGMAMIWGRDSDSDGLSKIPGLCHDIATNSSKS